MRLTSSIRKIDKNHYRLIINFGFDKSAGKYKKRQRDVHGTKPEAEAALREWVDELKQEPDKTSKQPLSEYLLHWVNNIAKPDLEQNTYESYRWQITNHINPVIGHIPLGELEPMHVQDLYSFKAAQGNLSTGGGLSSRAITYQHAILRRSLEKAKALKLIPENPCNSVKPPRDKRTQRDKMIVLSKKELAILLSNIKEHRDYALIHTAAYTGMRQSELLGLTWPAVLWDRKLIFVHQAIHLNENGKFEHRDRTKNATSTREVPVTDAVLDVLKRHRDCLMQTTGRKFNESGLVFPDLDGHSPQDRRNPSKRFSNLPARNGHEGMRFHDLRHTHATILLGSGIMVNVVSKRLGHAGPQTTLEIYGHVLPEFENDAALRFDALLDTELREISANTTEKPHFSGRIPVNSRARKRRRRKAQARHH